MTRKILEPSATHPITIEPTAGEVVVEVDGQVVARTHAALTLSESTYAPVQYVPIGDVDPAVLRASDRATFCPFKGDASYYSVAVAGGEHRDAVWTYAEPHPAVAEIRGHVAFYADRPGIDVTVAEPGAA